MSRNSSETTEHEQLVKDMVSDYKGKSYTNIYADLSGYTQPSTINGFIPDIVAKNPQGTWVILEAETCNTIDNSHTEQQWTAFYNYAKQNSAEFHVVVPKSCKDDAKTKLSNLGIVATLWT